MTNKLHIKKNSKILFQKINTLGNKLGIEIFVVGGYVRDLIIGKESKDIDFVVIGDALDFANQFKKKYHSSRLVTYPKFGTCMLQYKKYKLEFVSAREEFYSTNSRKPSVKKADLLSDLSRRDFTINTMAMDITKENFGHLIDPYDGITTLKQGIIITPLNPDQTFSDDPLRMMRAIRFASQLSFKIDPDTFTAIKHNADRLTIVSQERITEEFNKIIMTEKPSIGLSLLDSCKLLEIFLPELSNTKGIEQINDHHHKDVFQHTLQVVDQIAAVTNKIELRLAALFHDIAKPRTKRFDEIIGWTFYGHEIVGDRMAAAILHRLKYSKEIINYVRKIIRLHLRPMALVDETVTDSAVRRLLFLAREDFDDLMKLCRADITSKNPEKVKKHLKNYAIVMKKAKTVEKKDKIKSFKSPVDGNEIMNFFKLKPGPQIGKIKKFIEEAILDGEIPNEHDAAFDFISKHINNLI